ncbi:hypothetical protein TrVE_jg8553 [Triparma verrucosa]|uniref:Isochorismatase-like domain-containing protein n=1 Tax=Triparma verrucosa TaxID=1606542 RepID=A0A9W7KU10_9STRA|nr:hypothetical protein TrVE_jg8553 [Triparma verrucosa]
MLLRVVLSSLLIAYTTALANTMLRTSVGKLSPSTTCFLLCDVQDRFRSIIHHGDSVVSTSNFLLNVAKTLEIPAIGTEQYPKAFGRTCEDVLNIKASDGTSSTRLTLPIYEKKLFSMMTPEVSSHIQTLSPSPTSFVLFGIEAHVCVQQTCLDLLEQGHDVHVVVDGVSSQSPLDRDVALTRMANSGALLTTAQSVAFMLMGSAEHGSFKTVSKMIVEHGKIQNGFHEAARL